VAPPRAIDYYSVLTLLQILIFGAFFGISIVAEDRNSDMHIRMGSLPASRLSIFIGKVTASTLYLLMTSTVTILFSIFVYHANWNGNWAIIAITLILFCLFAVGLGLLIGLLTPSFAASLLIVVLFMAVFATVSGSISPANAGDVLGLFSPNYHAKILIFGSIYGYSQKVMLESAIWLCGFVAVVYALSAILIRRKRYAGI
jgi:ABC-type transport system involved in multi-copper enzyme maturation permease subunit